MDECVSGPEAAERSGCTYRQVTYWVRSGFMTPTGTPKRGNSLAFTERDIAILIALRRAAEAGLAYTAVGPQLAALRFDDNAKYLVVSGRSEDISTACLHDDHDLATFLSDDPGPHVVTHLRAPRTHRSVERKTA